MRVADHAGRIGAHFVEDIQEFVTLAVITDDADALDLCRQAAEVGGDVAGAAGIDALADDLIRSFSRFKRRFVQFRVNVEVFVEAEITDDCNFCAGCTRH